MRLCRQTSVFVAREGTSKITTIVFEALKFVAYFRHSFDYHSISAAVLDANQSPATYKKLYFCTLWHNNEWSESLATIVTLSFYCVSDL